MSPADRAVLAAVATELIALRGRVDDLSDLVSAHVRAQPAETRAHALVQAQSVDETLQRLEALAGVLTALSDGAAPEVAVAGSPLAALAARLSSVAAVAPSDAGDLMLFE